MCHSPSHYGVFCRSTSPGLTPMALYDFIWTRKKCKYSCLCWHHRRVHLHALILLFFPVGQGLSDLACLFPEHLPGWTHFGLSHPYGWLVKRDAPRRRKPQLESTEASTAPVRGWWPRLVRLWKEDGLPDTASSRSPHLPVSPSSPASPSPPPPPMADVVVSFDCIGKLQWYSKHPERYDDKWVQIPVNYFLLKSKFHSVCC